MGDSCGTHPQAGAPHTAPRYRRALVIALIVNLAMFVVEVGAGFQAGSAALLADAVDFFGDAANYGLSLVVLSMGLAVRARAALLKGIGMGGFGLYVHWQAAWNGLQGVQPEPIIMGLVGSLALLANLGVAALLYRWREGDANMRSVWLCTRNDAIGNLVVVLAALGVAGLGSSWPDLLVAVVMGGLALSASAQVIARARTELRSAAQGQRARA